MKSRLPEPIVRMLMIIGAIFLVVLIFSIYQRFSGETLEEHAARQAVRSGAVSQSVSETP